MAVRPLSRPFVFAPLMVKGPPQRWRHRREVERVGRHSMNPAGKDTQVGGSRECYQGSRLRKKGCG